LSIITVLGLVDEWFMVLLCCLSSLLFMIWQRSGSCCCYIVCHYCFRFERGVVHGVVILSTINVYGLTEEWFILLSYCLPLLFTVWQGSGSCCCYIVYHYCLKFDRGVVHVVVILSTINVYDLTEEWFILLLFCLP
jgi:hypothetical protein